MKSLRAISTLRIPRMFERNRHANICFQGDGKDLGTEPINSLVGQVLELTAPGMVRFLFIDHTGQGASFKAFPPLRDAMIGVGIATNPQDIRHRLATVVEAIASITQQKLRDIHPSLDVYNASVRSGSGASGEPFRFVVIANWPHGFDTDSCHMLRQILTNGPKCGVYVLSTCDRSAKLPHDVSSSDIWDSAWNVNLGSTDDGTISASVGVTPTKVPLSKIVACHVAGLSKLKTTAYDFSKMIQAVFESRNHPFDALPRRWGGSSDVRLVMPIGLEGGERIDSIVLGESGASNSHNVLILGPVGSGKSNLLHVMIHGLAEIYSPEEVRLYLIDGKYGTEFSRYERHRLPHARVVSLNSDPAFGLSVLREILEEMGRRGELFPEAQARDLKEYRERTRSKLPRIVLFLDEFQLLLSDDDTTVSGEAKSLLSKLAKQGRAYGIHLVLATQTLRGVDLPRDVQDQTAVRIVLGRSPDGFHGVLDQANRGADALEKLHALKNVDFGHPSGNGILQVTAALGEAEAGQKIVFYQSEWARQPEEARLRVPPTLVFKGNEPADLMDSRVFSHLLESPYSEAPLVLPLGEPVAVRETHTITLYRRAESNVLLLAKASSEIAGTVVAFVLAALAQRGSEQVRINVLDGLGDEPADTRLRELLSELSGALEDEIGVFHSGEMLRISLENLEKSLNKAELQPRDQRRTELLVVLGLHELRTLREDDLSGVLERILDRGPSLGIHVICWVNTLANLRKVVGRDLSTFGYGVVGTISSEDAGDLFPNPRQVANARNRLTAFDRAGFSDNVIQQVRAFTQVSPRVANRLIVDILGKSIGVIYGKRTS